MIFSYWDNPELAPVQDTLTDWRMYFPDFCILGDPDIEPMLVRHFPHFIEMFHRIRIPTCKSDLALLVALYELGGVYIDCHCGVRDPAAIEGILASLERYELVLYDRSFRSQPRPDGVVFPFNSVPFA